MESWALRRQVAATFIICCITNGWAAPSDGDNSQLHTAAANSLFPGGAGIQPLPLPLGPAYNNSNFKAFVNVTVSAYADGPASSFTVNITTLSILVNSLGKLYYPMGILFEVLSMVPANSNDAVVDCTIPQASGKMGVCVSMMVLLLDDTRTSFVTTSLDNVAVTQADVLHPPLLQPIFSFWSPIPTRTRTITVQLQGNQILPFPAYQEQATLGAIKNTLSNVAIFVSLDAAIPSTASPGRRLLASRAVPYVNITYDFDCFASLSLPTTVADWQVLSPQLLKNLQLAGVPVDVVQVVSVNFTTPADLVAAQAAAAATPAPPGQSEADKALTNSVAAAVDLTRALTDSMSKTLQALGYSPSTPPGAAAAVQSPPPQAVAPPRSPPSPPPAAAAAVPVVPAATAAVPAVPVVTPANPPAPGDTSAAPGRSGQGGKMPIGLLGGLFAGVITAIGLVVLAVLLYRRRRRKDAEDKAALMKDGENADPYHALNLNSSRQTGNGTQSSTGGYDSGSLNYPFLESRRSRNGGGPFGGGGSLSSGNGGSSSGHSGPGTSLLAGGRTGSEGSASSDAMKPPPGYTPAASIIAPQDLTICKKKDGSDWLLGQGTFGAVYKAMRRHVQECAVKVLKCINDDELLSFQREVYIMQQCSFDRNIVQFYGFCVSPPMLVLEFMEGGDMWSALRGNDREELQWYGKGRGLALDVARGLHFLHEHKACPPAFSTSKNVEQAEKRGHWRNHNVVHADMKTKNILLSAGRMTAKIADVGLARFMAHTHMDTKSLPMGTFVYAAPELLLGKRSDHKVDIYSFGIILWELVTLQTPARGNLRPVKVPEECPADVAHLIEDCLEANQPDKRPTASVIYDRLMASPATVEEARHQLADPEGYAAARELALGDVGPSGSGETNFHTAMAADSKDLPSTVEAGTYNANASQQSGLWNSEDFKSGALHTDTSFALSHSPTSTLQACSATATPCPYFARRKSLLHQHTVMIVLFSERFISAGSDWSADTANVDSWGGQSGRESSDTERAAANDGSADRAPDSMLSTDLYAVAEAPDESAEDHPAEWGAKDPGDSGGSPPAQAPVSPAAPEVRAAGTGRSLSPGTSLESIQESEEPEGYHDAEAEHAEMLLRAEDALIEEEIARGGLSSADLDAESDADSDSDAASDASSEALALAVAAHGNDLSDDWHDHNSREHGRSRAEGGGGLEKQGSVLAPAFSKGLKRLGSLLPRRNSRGNLSAASGTPRQSELRELSSNAGSLRATFMGVPSLGQPLDHSEEEDGNEEEDDGLSLRPAPVVVALPQRPKLAEPATPAGQAEPLPAFNRGKLSTTSGSISSITDTPAVSPAPSRVRFSTTSDVIGEDRARELSPRSPQTQPSGYLASRELSGAPPLPRVPRRPLRPPPRGALKRAGAGATDNATPPPMATDGAAATGPAAALTADAKLGVPPIKEAKKDPTQASAVAPVATALVSNFWEAAASRGYESSLSSEVNGDQQHPAPPAPGLATKAQAPAAVEKKSAPAPSVPSKSVTVTKLPSAAPPPIAAAAMDFWRMAASSSVEEGHEKPKSAPAKLTEQRAAQPPAMEKPEAAEFRPTQAPTPSTNLAANKFWQAAAQGAYGDSGESRSGSAEAAPVAVAKPEAAAAGPSMLEHKSGLAAAGKQQSARLAAVRLRQAAAVRSTSLAMVKAGNVPLSSAASIRSSALRAAEDSSPDSSMHPSGSSAHGKALWQRASQGVLASRGGSPPGSFRDEPPSSEPEGSSPHGSSPSSSSQRRNSSAATRSTWVRAGSAARSSGSRLTQGAEARSIPVKGDSTPRRRSSDNSSMSSSLRVQPSLDALASMSPQSSSPVISPFNSVLPPLKVGSQRAADCTEAERADDQLAQQLFQAAQARRAQSTSTRVDRRTKH
ncbi:probable serine/threonine-protein kinase CTR1 at N-terminal half [Coccomyxa sp. Obi]|nr:probable serine/threonine-protein kinase CTR1 at N-terminal half [Coccomyxa sp. Obi]